MTEQELVDNLISRGWDRRDAEYFVYPGPPADALPYNPSELVHGKGIHVPLEHYHTLCLAAACLQDEFDRLVSQGEALGADSAELRARLLRWYQWHERAEERGLTR